MLVDTMRDTQMVVPESPSDPPSDPPSLDDDQLAAQGSLSSSGNLLSRYLKIFEPVCNVEVDNGSDEGGVLDLSSSLLPSSQQSAQSVSTIPSDALSTEVDRRIRAALAEFKEKLEPTKSEPEDEQGKEGERKQFESKVCVTSFFVKNVIVVLSLDYNEGGIHS